MNSLDKMEDYDRLAKLCEAKDADIKRLAISEVDLEQKVHVLEAQIAMQAKALEGGIVINSCFADDATVSDLRDAGFVALADELQEAAELRAANKGEVK